MPSLRRLGHGLYTGEVSYEFVARKRIWYIISAILIVISIGAVLIRGLQFGSGASDHLGATSADEDLRPHQQEGLRHPSSEPRATARDQDPRTPEPAATAPQIVGRHRPSPLPSCGPSPSHASMPP